MKKKVKMKMNGVSFIVVIIILVFIAAAQSCNTTEPKLRDDLVTLTLIDVAVTEAYFHIKSEKPGGKITLYRDGKSIYNFIVTGNDTIITDTNLSEKTTYSYLAKLRENGELIGESNEIHVATLEPTSHDFQWETFTFGEHSSSSLYDVSIIGENNIWVVGEIYSKDSIGTLDPHPYNSAHWDGNKWELERIKTFFRGNIITVPLYGLFAFSSTDIWIVGSLPIHGNGNNWQMYDLRTIVDPNLTLSRLWGKSSDDMYFVGRSGNIAHYYRFVWQKLESGTEWDIYDIWGYTNPINSQEEIICASTNPNNYSNSTILKITSATNVGRIDLNTERLTGSAWTNRGFPIYTTGDGIFTNKNGRWKEIKLPVNYVTSKIRGNGLNDMFLCGVLGLIAHYNGKEWKIYGEVYNAVYTSVNLKGNVVAFVGWRDSKAVITIGKRN